MNFDVSFPAEAVSIPLYGFGQVDIPILRRFQRIEDIHAHVDEPLKEPGGLAVTVNPYITAALMDEIAQGLVDGIHEFLKFPRPQQGRDNSSGPTHWKGARTPAARMAAACSRIRRAPGFGSSMA